MRTTSLGLLALLLAACASTAGSPPDQSSARTIALAPLDRGVRSWNGGDRDAFVADYIAGHRTAFITRGPTSLEPEREGGQWGILEDHSS
jgi:hypothetical protein